MNKITIHAGEGKDIISRHIYGHFSEHLGRCIYGGFWVGEDSTIPNLRGIRKDVVQALRKIKIPNLRWPGGCFADEYHWTDGIGPREKRPTMINTHWGGVTENNHFGTHEFMELCDQLGCEPYICGNVGSGTVKEMSQWVEYLTFDGKSTMSDLRAVNGRKQPWKVRFWGVGNENWGCGGNMRPEYYADEYRRYNTYCRNYGENKLFRVACGPCGDAPEWTDILMKNAGGHMDGLAVHYYTVPGSWSSKGEATKFTEEEWFLTLKKAFFMEELVTRHSTIMDRYDPGKRVAMVVDEWGTWFDVEPGTNPGFLYQQNTLRDALAAGLTLNIFNDHCDRVRLANIAQTVNVLQAMILTEGKKMLLTPSYHVFEMYTVHHDAVRLPLHLECGRYEKEKESLPQISASASKDKKGVVHLSLCNLDHVNAAELTCSLDGMEFGKVTGRILTAEKMNAHNTFEKPETLAPVTFRNFRMEGGKLNIKLPAKSVAVLALN